MRPPTCEARALKRRRERLRPEGPQLPSSVELLRECDGPGPAHGTSCGGPSLHIGLQVEGVASALSESEASKGTSPGPIVVGVEYRPAEDSTGTVVQHEVTPADTVAITGAAAVRVDMLKLSASHRFCSASGRERLW